MSRKQGREKGPREGPRKAWGGMAIRRTHTSSNFRTEERCTQGHFPLVAKQSAQAGGRLQVLAFVSLGRQSSLGPLHMRGKRPQKEGLSRPTPEVSTMDLHQASAEGDERKIKSLLTGGLLGRILGRKSTEVDAPDQKGNTPLALAVQNGQVAAVALLLEHGANANASLRSGSTLLHDAAMRNDPDIASLLLDHEADIEAGERGSRMTPLAQAAFSGSTETAAVLLQRGASVGVRCWEGETSLHLAAKRGHVEVVRLLLDHGADINEAGNASHSTALHCAVMKSRVEVGALLLQRGADPNKKDEPGYAPLHWAAREKNALLVQRLLEHGADANALDRHGRSPLEIAGNHAEITGLIQRHAEARPASLPSAMRDSPASHRPAEGKTPAVDPADAGKTPASKAADSEEAGDLEQPPAMPNDALRALRSQVERIASQHQRSPSELDPSGKISKQLPWICRTLTEAASALESGRDPFGNPITSAQVIQGLGILREMVCQPSYLTTMELAYPGIAVPLEERMVELGGIIAALAGPPARASASDSQGVETLSPIFSGDGSLDMDAQVDRAVGQLRQEGEAGSRALAALIRELLACRSPKIIHVLRAAGQIVPTDELISAVQAVARASELTEAPASPRFAPEIVGEGRVGWASGTYPRVMKAALEAQASLESDAKG